MLKQLIASTKTGRLSRSSLRFLIWSIVFGAIPMMAQNDYLPTFRGAIDVTGFTLQIRATAPDRDSGDMIPVDMPPGLIGKNMRSLLSSPLSNQIAIAWNGTPSQNGLTPRAAACSQIDATLKQRAPIEGNIGCDLAMDGTLYYQQTGSLLEFAYIMRNNHVNFNVVTGLPVNPPGAQVSPAVSVSFDITIGFSLLAPNFCGLSSGNASAWVSSVQMSGGDAAGDLLFFLKDLFGFNSLDLQKIIDQVAISVPGPLNLAVQDVRGSDTCTGRDAVASRAVQLFGDFDISLDSRRAIKKIVLAVTYPKITPPTVDVPNPAHRTPPPPSLIPSMISSDKPSVSAGGTVQISGRYFQPNPNYSTQLPVTITHAGSNSPLGTCYGGSTELMWGLSTNKPTIQKLPGALAAPCAVSYTATSLTPGRSYDFKARDCDLITCSPWSASVASITEIPPGTIFGGPPLVGAFGFVTLNIDGVEALGSATVDANGTFSVPVVMPSDVVPGFHQIRAYHQRATVATAPILVTASGDSVVPAILMVGRLNGETGCPFHPITATAADSDFWLFGQGFARGFIVIRLDSPTAPLLTLANVEADGTFCRDVRAVGTANTGTHAIFATQRNALAQTTVSFVTVSPVH